MQDVSRSKLPIFYSLLWRFFIYDYFIAIIQMLLGFMRKHALKRFDLEISTRGLDVGCDHLICILWFDSPCCCLKCVPGSHEHVGLLALGFSSDDETVRARCWVAVYVCSEFDFDEVFHLQLV